MEKSLCASLIMGNIVIPLERKEDAEILVEKLNQLISNQRTAEIKERVEMRRAKRKLKRKSRGVSPSSYGTVPYYFPTEQADIVDKLKRKSKKQKKWKTSLTSPRQIFCSAMKLYARVVE
jgi:hypothetical protein